MRRSTNSNIPQVPNRYNTGRSARPGMFANAQQGGGGDDDPNNNFSSVVGYERAPNAADKVGNSLKGLLFGPVLIFLACLLLWHNEGWAIKTHRSLNEALDAHVPIYDAKQPPSGEYNGLLVHVSDMLTVDAPVTDHKFDLSRQAIALTRNVEIYQWVEKITKKRRKMQNGETEVREEINYHKQWVSDGFRHQRGHSNQGDLPMASETHRASRVNLGAYTISNSLTAQLNQSSDVPVSEIKPLPPGAEKKGNAIYFSIRGGGGNAELPGGGDLSHAIEERTVRMDGEEKVMYVVKATGDSYSTKQRALEAAKESAVVQQQQRQMQNTNEPEIGDVRVTFREIKCTTASVLAKLSGNILSKWQSKQGSGYDVGIVSLGTVSAHDMISGAQSANTVKTWFFRGGGWLLNVIGFSLITQIITTTADITLNWIPFFGPMANSIISLGVSIANLILGSCLTTTVAAIAWVVYRPVLGISMLAGSLGLFFTASRLGKSSEGAQVMGKNVKGM